MAKNYNSKHYLKKEFSFILNKLYIIKQDYELLKSLTSDEEKEYITDNIPHTSQLVLDSLYNNIIMELSKIIVDSSSFIKRGKVYENINIKNFLKKYDENKHLFKEKKYYYATEIDTNKRHRIYLDNKSCDDLINEYKLIEKQNRHLLNFLKLKRDKTLAHNDKEYGFKKYIRYGKKRITYEQLEHFINDIYYIVNNLNKSVFGITTAWSYYFKDELFWLKDLIKNNEKRGCNEMK